MRIRLVVLLLALLFCPAPLSAADKPARKPSPDQVFGLDKVWTMHLSISAKDWERMQPTNRGNPFGPPRPAEKAETKPAEKSADRKKHGLFGFDFEYVPATLQIEGATYKNVAVRYKGSGTYISVQGRPKRPFKIDLDRFVPGQSFLGLRKLTLNNNAMEPSGTREVLAYAAFRALDVPAPRTAYAALTLTVPGKYDKAFLGLYVLAESVEKTFLRDHFGSANGLLLKPERAGALEHFGDEWATYEQRYQPKTEASARAKRRLIEFTHLVQKADDKTFAEQINKFLDVDEFLRFLAGNVALSNMDSFIGFVHNYYLYLHPKTDRFVFIPWDVDLAYGRFLVVGSPEVLMDLSIRKPYPGGNRLIERLLADKEVYTAYTKHLETALAKILSVEKVKNDLAEIHRAIDPVVAKEKKAAAERGEPAGAPFGGMFNNAPSVETFVAKRADSIRGQLSGERKGTSPTFRMGPPPGGFGPGQFLAKPILAAADKDKDGKLSKDELQASVKTLFKKMDGEGKGELDEKAVAAGLDKIMPGPRPPGGRPPRGFPTLGEILAKVVVEKYGKGGKVTEAGLLAAADKLFAEADKDKDGALVEKDIVEAVNKQMPPPRFPPPGGGPPAAPAPSKEGRK